MNETEATGILTIFFLIGIAILAGLILLAIRLIKQSHDDAQRSEMLYAQILQSLPQEK